MLFKNYFIKKCEKIILCVFSKIMDSWSPDKTSGAHAETHHSPKKVKKIELPTNLLFKSNKDI